MAQTVRTLTEIFALLADNTTGQISPEDLRDAITTIQPDHGEISITSTAATTISDTSSFFFANGTYALSADNMNWDMNSNGQLRYTGTPDRVAHIAASFSFTTASNNQVCSIGVAKNGSVITPSIVDRKVGTGSDVGSSACHAFIEMSTNDYLTIVIRNQTGSNNATFETANLFAMGMAK